MRKYRDLPEPPEENVFAVCAACGGEIYSGETFGHRDGRAFCLECVEDRFSRMADGAKLAVMGYIPEAGEGGRESRNGAKTV